MSDRAWTILGVGVGFLGLGVAVLFPRIKLVGILGLLAGPLISLYGLAHDLIRSNRLEVIFSDQQPYTSPDPRYSDHTCYRLGVRGSKRLPRDVKALVTNIQSQPTEPAFREDYPYHLSLFSQKDERELLFDLATSWISSEGDRIVCGIQQDASGEFEKIRLQPHEVWDVEIQVISADSKPVETWLTIASANRRMSVRRFSWKPASLQVQP